jgi:hypothetical protein
VTNLLGYAASCAVLATFLTRTMVPLRLIAILSNVLFLVFGYVQHIYPVFFLHVALLPINAWRLVAVSEGSPGTSGHPPAVPQSGARPYTLWFAAGVLAGFAASVVIIAMTSAQLGLRP